MAPILIITGSPSSTSRSLRLAHTMVTRLRQRGLESTLIDLRTLPAEDLLHARTQAPSIEAVLQQLSAARGVVVVTPVYKAAYSGMLKTFLDLLPQFGLRDKVVLPLAVGGTTAHVLAIDYALRPVLNSLDPLHIVSGLFLLDRQLTVHEDGRCEVEAELSARLDVTIDAYATALARAAHQQPEPSPDIARSS